MARKLASRRVERIERIEDVRKVNASILAGWYPHLLHAGIQLSWHSRGPQLTGPEGRGWVPVAARVTVTLE